MVTVWLIATAFTATLGYVGVLLMYRANWITRWAKSFIITVDGEERSIYL